MGEAEPNELVRELLLSLQSAGVEYLPFSGKVPAPVPRPVRPVNAPVFQASPLAAPLPATPVFRAAEAPVKAKPALPAPIPPRVVSPFRTAVEKSPMPSGRLELLRIEAEQCTRCMSLVSTRTKPLFGFGPQRPVVLFLGEAPSPEEDRSERLFVGEVGELFDKILKACNLSRESVYLTNLLKCKLPGTRGAKPEECDNCRPFLDEQIGLIGPGAICCLGEAASRRLLGTDIAWETMRQSTRTLNGIPVYCTHHPKELIPRPELKKAVWDDLRRMLGELGRTI